MPSVADAIAMHGPDVFGSLSIVQQTVLSLITRCRTGALGGVLHQCQGCGREHWTGRSCGNRHCTSCGHEKTQEWIEKQRAQTMPVHHFLVTFTVPRELALVLRAGNDEARRSGYGALLDASSGSMIEVGAKMRSLKGCKLGFFGVLHTWGRDLQTYHPHIHYVVPGGGVKLDEQGNAITWQSTANNFLFHHATLIEAYKLKLGEALQKVDLYEQVPSHVWAKDFVVDIRPVGHADATLKYLAPYVHRVAISDKRIVSVDQNSVKYNVRPSKTNRTITREIEGDKFVRAFAQHILPPGFQKIRRYGWMSGNSKISLDEVKWLVWLHLGWTYWLASGHAPPSEPLTAPLRCASCGGEMKVVDVTYDWIRIDASDKSLAYFDSG